MNIQSPGQPPAPISKETHERFGNALGELCEAFAQVQEEVKKAALKQVNATNMKFTLASTGQTYDVRIAEEVPSPGPQH